MEPSPFTLSPNPAWMYLTPSTIRSIQEIRWMIEDRQGLACIFGDAGYGKSTLLRYLTSEYSEESLYKTTLLTRVDFKKPFAFAVKLSADFGIPPKRSLAAQNDALEEFLFAEHEAERTVIAFMDEGQQLTSELLEQVRGLLNFETNTHKLIQIVVAGQLGLLDRIKAKRNKALASRIYSPVVIQPLDQLETAEMVKFRCARARLPCPFTDDALSRIFDYAKGNPRATLLACGRAVKEFPGLVLSPNHIDQSVGRGPAEMRQAS